MKRRVAERSIRIWQKSDNSDDPLTWLLGLRTSNKNILNSTGMDAFSVWHTDRTKCSYQFLFIKTAANIFLASDQFYKVILYSVLYSLPISVTSL